MPSIHSWVKRLVQTMSVYNLRIQASLGSFVQHALYYCTKYMTCTQYACMGSRPKTHHPPPSGHIIHSVNNEVLDNGAHVSGYMGTLSPSRRTYKGRIHVTLEALALRSRLPSTF